MACSFVALPALADDYAETGELAKAVEVYQELSDKLMAWNPHTADDLRDATCLSRTWAALAALMSQLERKHEATQLIARRSEVCARWQEKLPDRVARDYLCSSSSPQSMQQEIAASDRKQ